MSNQSWKIGELAQRVGLTVRTLHHYDRIGLFSPSSNTESGHRLYSHEDVRRLQQIISLKELGFGLKEIRAMINDPAYDPVELLRLQLSHLNQEIDTLVKLRERVRDIYHHLQLGRSVSADEFMTVMQMMNLVRSPLFRPEQVEGLRGHYLSLDANTWGQLHTRGQELMSAFRRCLDTGKPPDDPCVVDLARQWKEEIAAFAPADEEFIRTAEHYYRGNPDAGLALGMDRELYLYIKQAISFV